MGENMSAVPFGFGGTTTQLPAADQILLGRITPALCGDSRPRTLSFPLIVLAQQRLVLLALRADLGERCFHAGEHVGSFTCGVQFARGQREIDAKRVVFLSRVL